MEKLANLLANNISVSLGYNSHKRAVIAYGLMAIIQITFTLLLVITAGIISGVVVQSLIICLTSSILRKYSGGVHAASAEMCTCFCVVYCTATALAAKFFLAHYFTYVLMISFCAVIYFFAFWAVKKYAPVDSPNKPIYNIEKRIKMRRRSFIVVSALFFISAVMLMLSGKIYSFRSYGISILFGLFWQAFTLTPVSYKVINYINSFFSSKEVKK